MVVAIIAGLIGVVIFSLRGLGDSGQAKACRTEKRLVRAAVQAYHAESGRYPTSVRQLVGTSSNSKSYLDKRPTWYKSIGKDGSLTDPLPGRPCHGV